MRANNRSFLASAILFFAACGGEPPLPPSAPTSLAPLAVAAPPSRARWVFAQPERGLNAKLDLGGAQTLFVGQHGRRALAKGDEPLVEAPTLALEHLVGVLRDGSDYAFVADDGDVFVSHEPLGPLDTTREGPAGEDAEGRPTKLATIATGRASFVGITNDGRVLRSADFGKGWAPVDYAGPAKPFGHAYAIAIDSKGNGLLLALPQRLYLTRDDGATWAPIATPGIGANRVHRDGADQLFLEGPQGIAKLDGGQLVVSREGEAPLRRLPPRAPGATPPPEPPARTLLTGDRVVELTLHRGARPNVEVSSRKLGEPPSGAGAASAELVSARTSGSPSGEGGVSANVAGFGGAILYARADDTKDADGALTTTILRSANFGATWKSEATFKGHLLDHGYSERDMVSLAAGPGGWAFVRGMCPGGVSAETNDRCTRRQIRPAGAAGYEDMVAVDDFVALRFAFDEAHGKVYALGRHDDRVHVYESQLGTNRFVRLSILDVRKQSNDVLIPALTVDPAGVLRVLTYDGTTGWKLLRHAADGTDAPILYAPIDSGAAALSGLRGIVPGLHSSWETADGGESWTRIASTGYGGEPACVEAGCVMGGAERVGWELPAYQGGERVIASTEPNGRSITPPPRRPPTVPPAPLVPLELACKPAGAATPVPAAPAMESVDGRPSGVRWSEVKEDRDHKISILFGTRSEVRELSMLGPEPPRPAPKPGGPPPEAGVQHRTSVFRQPEGVVAVRAVWTPRVGETPTVDLDIAWWSAATGRASHRALARFKPFNVPRSGSIGEARVVDGGVLYRSTNGEPVHFLRDDGRKEETFTVPNGAEIAAAVRAGDRWILPALSSGSARLTFSDDNGEKWTTKTWRLDEGATMHVVTVGGKPHIGFHVSVGMLPSMYTMGLVPIGAIPDDPPAPVVAAPGPADAACGAEASTYRAASAQTPGSRPLRVRFDNADKTSVTGAASDRVAHPTAAGTLCTAAYHLNTSGESFVYAEPTGFSGVRFRKEPDPKEADKSSLLAEPLACAPVPRP